MMRALGSLLAFSVLAWALPSQAQTTVTNQSGGCTSAVLCTLPLNGGTGSVTFYVFVSPNCSFGRSCTFLGGTDGSYFSYSLPDGSSATGTTFSGTMAYNSTTSCGAECSSYSYTITGTFSGQDSQGRTFNGNTRQAIVIETHSRGGDNASSNGGTTTLTYTSGPKTLSADFSLTASPTALTIQAGQSASVTVTLTPQGGYSGAPTFACSGLPASAACIFTPPTLVADGTNTPLVTRLSINTSSAAAAKASAAPPALTHGRPAYAIFMFFGTVICTRLQRWTRKALLAAGMLALAFTLSCGAGSATSPTQSPTTPLSSSTVLVTAASPNGPTHSVSISLTLTP